ncbi:MAG TPA: hypothetical protein VFT95_21305 [Micromonosporaceae bacterium]|nr:hypothetical protein [Micromonosporaceae bacterium]
MRTRSLRRLTAVTALALASAAAAAACTSTPTPTAPSPTGTAPASAAPTTAIPTPAVPAVPVKPVHGGAPDSTSTSRKCHGTIVHRINAADRGPPWKPLCITVGGVLRFENIGPGNLRVSPLDKVDCWYEGGVVECRLIQTGTVRFTVTRDDKPRGLTVVIAKAPSNPGPDPACPRVYTYTLDAADISPYSNAICMKLNTMLRIVNFGPDGFTVSPTANVSGWYQDGERQFTFVKTGTVTFTLTYPDGGTRTFTVVVIK